MQGGATERGRDRFRKAVLQVKAGLRVAAEKGEATAKTAESAALDELNQQLSGLLAGLPESEFEQMAQYLQVGHRPWQCS